jgi:predicted dienelactone hydrolase
MRVGSVLPGFLLGGYTVIEVAGGRTDPALFQKFCRSPNSEGCVDPPEFPDLFERWAELDATNETFRQVVSQSKRSYRDPRVRAVFAIAPALGPAFIPESLRRVTAAVAIVAGTDDSIVPVHSNAQLLAKFVPRARLTLLPGVGHYTFLASCTEHGRRARPQLCAEASAVDREAVHQRTADSAVRFFDKTLR